MSIIQNVETVLLVVAHADDETLGAGGTIARHVHEGCKVFAISMTDGIGAREGNLLKEAELRKEAAESAAKILGFEWLDGEDFPDNAMDTQPVIAITKAIEKVKLIVKPSIIYTHSTADLNVDHRVVCQATLTAFRPQPDEDWNEIRSFEVPSATDFGHPAVTSTFQPNLFVDITNYWPKKLKALEAYHAEMRNPPHTRSYNGLDVLSQTRGNQVGVERAEAFQLLRKIYR